MIIDSHTHAWGPPTRDHPWVNEPLVTGDLVNFSVKFLYTAERLLDDMDVCGVDRAVVVGYPICEWTDNWYTIKVAEEYDRLTGIVMLDPFAEGSGETLRKYMDREGILGFRLGAIYPRETMWSQQDSAADWLEKVIKQREFWDAVLDADAVCQIYGHEEQIDQVIKLVHAYPDVRYLLDHFAHARPNVRPGESPFSRVAELSEIENVALKASEVVHRSRESFPYEDMHDYVRWMVDRFGEERVIWGSDFPNVSDESTYEESLRWLNHVEGLSEEQRIWISGRSFEEFVNVT